MATDLPPTQTQKASATKAPRKIGRPTLKTPELCAEICERLARGETLPAICASPGFPDSRNVYRWLESDSIFRQQYARAREEQADYFADQIVELADSATPETANAVRLKVDARKWHTSKIAPKKYGDKPAETHVTTHVGATVLISAESAKELQARHMKLLEDTKKALPAS